MSVITRQITRTSQPQELVGVSAGAVKDLALTSVWVGSRADTTLVKSEKTVLSGAVLTTSSRGKVARFVGGASQRVQVAGSADSVLGTDKTTIAVLRKANDTIGRDCTQFSYGAEAVNRCLAHAPYSDGNIYWDFGTATTGRLSTSYVKDTQWETLVFVAGQLKGREIWRRGVKIAANTATKIVRPASSNNFFIGADNTGYCDDNEVALFVASSGEWTDAQIVSWCSNPWHIFEPITETLWIPSEVAVGGITTVSSDTVSSYLVRNTAQQDLAASFSIRSVLFKDFAPAFNIRESLSPDLPTNYVVRGAVTPDLIPAFSVRGSTASDAAPSYTIRTAAALDLVPAFNVRGAVPKDVLVDYNLRGLMQADAATGYSLRGAVGNNVVSTYSILNAGTVTNDLSPGYVVRSTSLADLSPSFVLRGVASADAATIYNIRAAASSSLSPSYTVTGAISTLQSDLDASYSVFGVAAPSPTAADIAQQVLALLNPTNIADAVWAKTLP